MPRVLSTLFRTVHRILTASIIPPARPLAPRLRRCPIPLHPGEIDHFIFKGVSLFEPRVVGHVYQQLTAPADMYLNGQPITVSATMGRTLPQVADTLLGEGLLVMTEMRLVFASGTWALSIPWGEIITASATADALTIIRHGTPAIKFVGDGGGMAAAMRAIANG